MGFGMDLGGFGKVWASKGRPGKGKDGKGREGTGRDGKGKGKEAFLDSGPVLGRGPPWGVLGAIWATSLIFG